MVAMPTVLQPSHLTSMTGMHGPPPPFPTTTTTTTTITTTTSSTLPVPLPLLLPPPATTSSGPPAVIRFTPKVMNLGAPYSTFEVHCSSWIRSTASPSSFSCRRTPHGAFLREVISHQGFCTLEGQGTKRTIKEKGCNKSLRGADGGARVEVLRPQAQECARKYSKNYTPGILAPDIYICIRHASTRHKLKTKARSCPLGTR